MASRVTRLQEEQEREQIVVQTEDGQPLTDEEIAAILAQQGDEAGEEGSAQIVDADGNVVSVTAEQLAAAGIDINNMQELTEDQLSTLLQLANSATVSTATTKSVVDDSTLSLGHQESSVSTEEEELDPGNGQPGDLTMVLGEDGSLRLVDPSGTEFLLTAQQLTANGIDITNLTEDQVQTILQLAMSMEPVKGEKRTLVEAGGGGKGEGPGTKRMKMDAEAGREGSGGFDDGTGLMSESGSPMGMLERESGGGNRSGSIPTFNRGAARGRVGTPNYSMIGQEVEVRKAGRSFAATIRYCRQGAGYKVQFEDGHFEWVSEDQIQVRDPSMKKRTDHESYTGDSADESTTNVPTGPKPLSPHTHTHSSLLRRNRVPPAIPGIKVSQPATVALGAEEERGLPEKNVQKIPEPNFTCPICANRVYQKEPAYIVIRLPACESCADSKIMVLDEETGEEDEDGIPEGALPPGNKDRVEGGTMEILEEEEIENRENLVV